MGKVVVLTPIGTTVGGSDDPLFPREHDGPQLRRDLGDALYDAAVADGVIVEIP
jgi:hypothetical protein